MSRILAFFLAVAATIFSLFNPSVNDFDYAKYPVDTDCVRVMSYNLKDGFHGEEAAKKRYKYVGEDIAESMPDSFGVQESAFQWEFYCDAMFKGVYGHVGESRSFFGFDESCNIFYLKDKYKVIDWDTFWLSEKPNVKGSTGWDSDYPRICTWVILENKETGKRYAHVNTHFDAACEAQNHQADIVVEKVKELEKDYPVVLTGDFYIYYGKNNYSKFTDVLNDAKYSAVNTDNTSSFRGWTESGTNKYQSPDIIFTSKNLTVKNFKVIDNIRDGVYPSDHCAIYADIVF